MLAVGAALLAGRGSASPSPSAPLARVVYVATPHQVDPTSSEVRWASIDARGARVDRSIVVPHAPGAVVRGALVPGSDVAVLAADDDARDRDFDATLYRADAKGLRQLATGLVHASLPLPYEGEAYVERGASGAPPTPEAARAGLLRVDALTIDAIDLETGAARTLLAWSGYALHLAGVDGGALVVYRVGPAGAEIVTVDRATGAARVVAPVLPFARDFSVQGGALVMSNRDDADPRAWVAVRVDLASGSRVVLHTERDDAPAPFATPTEIVWSAPRRSGLARAGVTIAPLGAGFDAACATTDDGAFLALVHVPPSGFDEAVVVHLPTSRVVRLGGPDERAQPLGFADARAGVLR